MNLIIILSFIITLVSCGSYPLVYLSSVSSPITTPSDSNQVILSSSSLIDQLKEMTLCNNVQLVIHIITSSNQFNHIDSIVKEYESHLNHYTCLVTDSSFHSLLSNLCHVDSHNELKPNEEIRITGKSLITFHTTLDQQEIQLIMQRIKSLGVDYVVVITSGIPTTTHRV